MEAEENHIVIGPDGTVLAVSSDLPPRWVDVRLNDCQDLPQEVRDAGRSLLADLRRSTGRVVARSVPIGGGGRLQLIAIEAMPVRRRTTDVRALLISKLGVIASQAADVDVSLDIETASDVPQILDVDPEKVAWAVTTLVGNALRYMRTGPRKTGKGTIRVRTRFDASRALLRIEVQDDGPGVQAETIARLFNRDALNVRGSGLALLLIADACAAHGGTVEVRSGTGASDHGTTVAMTFPARST